MRGLGRNTLFATLTLLVGLAPARAQQFHLERDFDYKRTMFGEALHNIYWVSLPYIPHVADVANSDAPQRDKCVGDPSGPAAPDGIINADDLICHWWTARFDPTAAGVFAIGTLDTEHCTWIYRGATLRFGIPTFIGSPFTVPCDVPAVCGDRRADVGYQINIGTTPGQRDPRNHAVIEGDHDDAYPGYPIVASMDCPTAATQGLLISVPYNTAYRASIEILCGQRGVDWIDDNGNFWPDDAAECTHGIFDGVNSIQVMRFFNEDPRRGGINGIVPTLAHRVGGQVHLVGDGWVAIEPGEACMVQVTRSQLPTVFLSPVR